MNRFNRGKTVQGIAKAIGITRRVVYRIRDDRPVIEAALARWNA